MAEKSMNIVFSLDFFPQLGGAHVWLYEVFRRWPQDILFLTSFYEERSEFSGPANLDKSLNVFRIFCRSYRDKFGQSFFRDLFFAISVSLKVSKYLRNSPSLLFSARIIPETFYLSFVPFLKKTKIVTFAHGEEFTSVKTSRLLTLYAKFALKRTFLIIANSFFTKGLVLENFRYSLPVEVVHLGVDYEKYQVSREEVERFVCSKGLNRDSIILFTVSRLEPRKNHVNVLYALKKLVSKGYPIKYIIAGDGSYKERLISLVEALGLNQKVSFWGPVDEYEKVLAFNSADIFIMPSIQIGADLEGFGIVFMEAAAAGVPSIAGNVGGQPEAVIHGKTGLVVDGKNVDEIAKAIRFLIENPEVRRSMGKEARKWAKEHDWSKISKITYEKVKSYL